MKTNLIIFLLCLSSLYTTAFAGEADVIDVAIKKNSNNTYDFSVTVLHKDTGWEHYANKWDVTDEKGTVLGARVLYHPHVDEQPFTRSLSGVKIPKNIKSVIIRAHDSVHGYGGKVMTVALPE